MSHCTWRESKPATSSMKLERTRLAPLSSSQGTAGTAQSTLFSCLTGPVPSILLSLTQRAAQPQQAWWDLHGWGAALGTSPGAGHEGRGGRGLHSLVPGPPEEKETSRDRQLRDRQETGTRSAQMQEPRSELQTKVIRQAVLNSRVNKGFIGRAPSGKSAEAPGLARLRPSGWVVS